MLKRIIRTLLIIRVLKPHGRLVFSELLPDPDSLLPGSLIYIASIARFRLYHKSGNYFDYTLIFEKPEHKKLNNVH